MQRKTTSRRRWTHNGMVRMSLVAMALYALAERRSWVWQRKTELRTMIDGVKANAARARAEALFRKDGEKFLGPRWVLDPSQAELAEKTIRLRALRLAKEEAD